MKKLLSIAILLSLVISGIQCSVYETLTNVSRLKFKVGAVNGFAINGVSITGKSKLADFGALDLFCLLYTSDAADERSSVDLGGRRIIKKKKLAILDVGRRLRIK